VRQDETNQHPMPAPWYDDDEAILVPSDVENNALANLISGWERALDICEFPPMGFSCAFVPGQQRRLGGRMNFPKFPKPSLRDDVHCDPRLRSQPIAFIISQIAKLSRELGRGET
jgi:hypothetical protein